MRLIRNVYQTGYLPDSVYRELAWYGILQIQPLHHSAKHKVAAQLIWQHTLGRPHVIMENPPQVCTLHNFMIFVNLCFLYYRRFSFQSTQSAGKVSRQILAEEAAKWSREQRAAQEVLMENIKSGGNGLTVRTVISQFEKTVYIIQNGKYLHQPYFFHLNRLTILVFHQRLRAEKYRRDTTWKLCVFLSLKDYPKSNQVFCKLGTPSLVKNEHANALFV